LIKKAMKGHVDLLGPAMAVKEELMGIPDFNTPDYSELFAEEKQIIANLKKAFLMIAGSAVQKFGQDLEEHQQILMAASDILIQIYMAESALLRTQKNANRFGEDSQKHHIAMAKLYLFNAVEKVNAKGKEAIILIADSDEQRMMLMGLKRYTKYTNFPNIVDLRNTVADKVIQENAYCF